jgi:MYXO-CTERM domain-containing protein
MRLAPAAVVLVLLAPTPARAYVQAVTPRGAPWHWDRPVVTLKVYDGQPVPELSSAELVQAVRGAAAPWSQPQLACTSIELTVEEVPEATAPVKRDGINRLVFRRDQWCPDPREPGEPCYSPQILAQTTDVVELATGRILESDIEVNAVDHPWSDLVRRPGDGPRASDLQNALTHELGHLLGFAHSCHLTDDDPSVRDDQGRPVLACTEASAQAMASTMYPAVSETDVDRRTLTDDDQRGACDVYPRGITRGQTEVEASGGGCAVAGARHPPAFILALALALALVLGARYRRRVPCATAVWAGGKSASSGLAAGGWRSGSVTIPTGRPSARMTMHSRVPSRSSRAAS